MFLKHFCDKVAARQGYLATLRHFHDADAAAAQAAKASTKPCLEPVPDALDAAAASAEDAKAGLKGFVDACAVADPGDLESVREHFPQSGSCFPEPFRKYFAECKPGSVDPLELRKLLEQMY